MSEPQPNRDTPAFTLVELLVVIAVVAVLATLTFASQGSGQQVLRVQCASNLRQIGVGLNVYAADANDYLPICGWPQGQNPWQTYEACRVTPGTSTIVRGYESLGLLFRTKAIKDPRLFYCPAQTDLNRSYGYYATLTNGWPSTPIGSGDDNIRCDYNYYPQLRVTERVGPDLIVPQLRFTSVRLEFGGSWSLVAPIKLTEVNPQRSITTDLVHTASLWSHQADGSVAGVNALFPDGSVIFQNARADPQNFDPAVWANIGADTLQFRKVMNYWEP